MAVSRAEVETVNLRRLLAESANGRHGPAKSDRRIHPVLKSEALVGAAGDFVRMVAPHTEADEAAILLQFLAGMGAVFGRSAYFPVEADRHFGNLFVVIVGESSKARKGTSWGHVRNVLEKVDPSLAEGRIVSGLASGEGLIWHVRDPIGENDPGETDKRLLVTETEFARALTVAERENNTLSAVLRQAWDEGKLQTLTRKESARATNAHVSVIGHITADELKRKLSDTATANGFANRFLWVYAKRSKLLPDGGNLDPEAIDAFVARLKPVVEGAKLVKRFERDDEARRLWHSGYAELSEGQPGLFGSVTSRAEAQVVRLSLLYALLAGTNEIEEEHMRAALAVWDYCRDSARFIFGDALGDATADDILNALRAAGAVGLTRSDLRGHFKNHKPSAEISRALGVLEERGETCKVMESGEGRSTERWFYLAR